MENDAREVMAEMERAEAAPYVSYGPSPWWLGPYFGLYFAVLVTVFSDAASDHTLLYLIVVAVLLGSLMLVLRRMAKGNGAFPMPGRGNPPPEIARAYRIYFWSLVPVGIVLLTAWWLLPTVAAAAVAFGVVTVGYLVYDRYYHRAAAAVRERLA